MADDNKPMKYMRYAIGEIVLVVIGILIALQINNWNENRKQKVVVQNYYNQILIDLKIETNYINEYIILLDSNITSYKTYLAEFKTPNLDPEDLIPALSKVNYDFHYIKFNINAVETLLSTGDTKLIPLEIRNKLVSLNRNQDATVGMA